MVVLAALWPCSLLAQERSTFSSAGRLTTIYGSVGLEAEKYRYESPDDCHDRSRLRARFDMNGRGYVWDPRFAVFDVGVTLQRETVKTRGTGVNGDTDLNMIGYRLSTTWFANKPYPLTLYASRSQSTVADFWSPTYELTTTNMGARWGIDHRTFGRTSFYLDRSNSESGSALVPRSERNLALGMDVFKSIRAKEWGQSELSYGYRHTAWDELVYNGSQRQDYFYLNDHTALSDKANAMANVTYFKRSDQWQFSESNSSAMRSSFLGANSVLTVQESEAFRYNVGLGLGLSDAGGSKNSSFNLTSGANYRFDPRWQTTATAGLSRSSTEVPAQQGVLARNQQNTAVSTSGAVLYSDTVGNFLVSGGYTLGMINAASSGETSGTAALPAQRTTTDTAQFGYTRMNSPLFTDSLQLRVGRTQGDPSGNESNFRYSVTSLMSLNDMLQGIIEYRRYRQESSNLTSDSTNPNYYYYNMSSRNTRFDLGWLHRFTPYRSSVVSAGATSGETLGYATETRYFQVRASMRLHGALQWTALARSERITGFYSIAGRKTTVESDLVYPLGKWEAILRYRLRDAKMEFAPFKEQSITFFLKRNFGLRR